VSINSSSITGDLISDHYCTVLICPSSNLYASTLEGIVVKRTHTGEVVKLLEGWQMGLTVHRLKMYDQTLYACTNQGLFLYQEGAWTSTSIKSACYQVKEHHSFGFAATEDGLWAGASLEWEREALAGLKVYDFLSLPNYIVIAHEKGMSYYDRYMGTWADIYRDQAVTCLAAFHNHLVGTNDLGQLIIGNKKGGLDAYTFGNLHMMGVTTKEHDVFVCTDRGLFRLGFLGGSIQLLSVINGPMVTDVDQDYIHIYVATMFDGIQTIPRS
jgi:ligand-binding sensor domain-containing protein